MPAEYCRRASTERVRLDILHSRVLMAQWYHQPDCHQVGIIGRALPTLDLGFTNNFYLQELGF